MTDTCERSEESECDLEQTHIVVALDLRVCPEHAAEYDAKGYAIFRIVPDQEEP